MYTLFLADTASHSIFPLITLSLWNTHTHSRVRCQQDYWWQSITALTFCQKHSWGLRPHWGGWIRKSGLPVKTTSVKSTLRVFGNIFFSHLFVWTIIGQSSVGASSLAVALRKWTGVRIVRVGQWRWDWTWWCPLSSCRTDTSPDISHKGIPLIKTKTIDYIFWTNLLLSLNRLPSQWTIYWTWRPSLITASIKKTTWTPRLATAHPPNLPKTTKDLQTTQTAVGVLSHMNKKPDLSLLHKEIKELWSSLELAHGHITSIKKVKLQTSAKTNSTDWKSHWRRQNHEINILHLLTWNMQETASTTLNLMFTGHCHQRNCSSSTLNECTINWNHLKVWASLAERTNLKERERTKRN